MNTKVNDLENNSCCIYFELDKSIQKDKQNLKKKNKDVENKMSNVGDLVTTTVLTTKIVNVENKIPDISDLVTAAVINPKSWRS